MRTFLLSLAVFCLILGVLVFTGRYLVRKTAEVSTAANNLPTSSPDEEFPREEARAALRDLTTAWQSARKAIHFLVGHEEVDKIDDYLTELQIRALTRDVAEYMSVREKLLQSLTRLAESETFSFDTVT